MFQEKAYSYSLSLRGSLHLLIKKYINPFHFYLQLFQTLDEKRIDHTRDNLWKCTNLESRICVEQDEVCFLLLCLSEPNVFVPSLVVIRDLLFNYTKACLSQYNFFSKQFKINWQQYIYFCIIKSLILNFLHIYTSIKLIFLYKRINFSKINAFLNRNK